jgi:hypothetical protein
MKLLKRLRGERGQVIIMFVGIFTIITVIGLITIDFGLWFSERRGAQTDADLPSLAGAAELTVLEPGPGEVAEAIAQAEDFLARNDEAGNAWLAEPVLVDDSCFSDDPRDKPGLPDSVTVNVNHDSRALFGEIFGIEAPDIGAHAKACAGSLWEAEGLFPIGVPMQGNNSDCFDTDANGDPIPIYGSTCAMAVGAGQGSSGETGTIKLFNGGELTCSSSTTGGGRTLRDEVEAGGANTTCSVGDLVWPKTGVGSNPLRQSLKTLIDQEATDPAYRCDEDFGDGDTHDQFLEVVVQERGEPYPSADAEFAPRECDSPRLVQLIMIDSYDVQGNAPSEIIAFANFFIAGCERVDLSVQPPLVLEFSETCDIHGQQGHIRMRGEFVYILQTSGPIGPRNNFGTPAIALAE